MTEEQINVDRHNGDDAENPVEMVRGKIARAIIDHQLLPKTKLREGKLAEALNVSRARVREALGRLEVEQIVVSIPNRGTYVAAPSIEEAKQILDARRLIEGETVRRLAEEATAAQCAELRKCVETERQAWLDGDRHRAITLSREFHYLMVELSGNQVLADLLRNVIARMSLAVALYERPHHPDCLFDEHVALVEAIERRDSDRAVQIALSHLDHLGKSLEGIKAEPEEMDFNAIFSGDA